MSGAAVPSYAKVRGGRWALLLAGGDGTRLRSLTRELAGDDRPKQFCRVMGGETLLEQTCRRALLSVPRAHVMTVLTEQHERFYETLIPSMGIRHVVVQPRNRGTAPGVLYPLLRLAALAPDASVAVFPSDHHFSSDRRFATHVDTAFAAAEADPGRVVLLGIIPDTHETEYGWMEPGGSLGLPTAPTAQRVRQFWEKPEAGFAATLRERGCMWNSFVMVGMVRAFLALVRDCLPSLFAAFATLGSPTGGGAESLAALYRCLPPSDFSRDVLAVRPERLGVIPVWGVTWSDLGSPERVRRVRRELEPRIPELARA
ncbi:MAG TPA: sugar phosphate nucleotidyltransferase [Methylomirabilota bacterium]|nr:sugar phosphate nucleotidyltransferase [Methylomirabilota bacterium]